MKLSRRKFAAAVLILFSAIALTGFGCKPRNETGSFSGVTLVVWGLWQESSQLESIITSFQETTGVDVEYKKLASVAEYERELLEAFAEGRGPDIFVIHHTWVESKRGLMSAAPPDVIDERAVREEFVDVVADDLIRDGQIFALPTSVDSLALYYNKDMLSAAGVARPPRTWDEFQEVVERLTAVTRFGTIGQSAAAIGTAQNISRAADILQLLMLQSGVPITGANNDVNIATDEGIRALTFYTDFANKSKNVYTWDLQQHYSIDAFAQAETAMMFNYSYHVPTVRAKNPRLRFDIAPMPQIADSKVVNFAAYWPFAVSMQSPAPSAAWAFLKHMTSSEQSLQLNLAQQTPPARRDGVRALQRNPALGVFAEQALTAVSWPRADIVATDAIVNTLIDNVITGAATSNEGIQRAQDQLNQVQQRNIGGSGTSAN